MSRPTSPSDKPASASAANVAATNSPRRDALSKQMTDSLHFDARRTLEERDSPAKESDAKKPTIASASPASASTASTKKAKNRPGALTSSVRAQLRFEEQEAEVKKEEPEIAAALEILKGDPERVRIYLGEQTAAIYNNPSIDESAKDLFLKASLSGVATSQTAKTVLFLHAALNKIKSLPENDPRAFYKIKKNEEGGINAGYIISNEFNGKRYFVKSFLTSKVSGKRKINEYFIYKILEYLGYGPKCHVCSHEKLATALITEDLSVVKSKETDEETTKVFETYGKISAGSKMQKYLNASVHSENDSSSMHIMATEILVRLLRLSDVHKNLGNTGFVFTEGPKNPESPKVKPKIVDFHHDTVSGYEMLTSQESADNVHFEEIEKDLRDSEMGQSLPFTKRVQSERLKSAYFEALSAVIEGRDKRPPLSRAVERAFVDCTNLSKEMRGSREENEFDIDRISPPQETGSIAHAQAMAASDSMQAQNLVQEKDSLLKRAIALKKYLLENSQQQTI